MPRRRRRFESLESRVLPAVDLLAHVNPPPLSSDPRFLTVAGEYTYFWTEHDGDDVLALHRTDGTPEGTIALDVVVSESRLPRGLAIVGNSLFIHDRHRLLVTQGTPATTHTLIDDIEIRSHLGMAVHNGRVFFVAKDKDIIRNPWKTDADVFVSDGTPDGTGFLVPGPNISSEVKILGPHGDQLLFEYYDDSFPLGAQLWQFDGTSQSQVALSHDSGLQSTIEAELPNSLVGIHRENYVDHLALVDRETLQPSIITAAMRPSQFVTADNLVFFLALANDRTAVWRTDGTVQGTVPITAPPVSDDVGIIRSQRPVWFQDKLYFFVDASLWAYDPANEQMQEVVGFAPYWPVNRGDWGVVHGDHIYFVGGGPQGQELWKTDGTAAGTTLVADVMPGQDSSRPDHFVSFGDQLLFAATHNDVGRELWALHHDGDDLQLLSDVQQGYHRYTLDNVLNRRSSRHHDALFFTIDDGIHGKELWRVDGTIGTAHLVKDIRQGAQGGRPSRPVSWGERIFFTADDGVHGRSLWSSDGTAEGTRLELEFQTHRETAGKEGFRLLGLADGVLLKRTNQLLFWDGKQIRQWRDRKRLGAVTDVRDVLVRGDETYVISWNGLFRSSGDSAFARVEFDFAPEHQLQNGSIQFLPNGQGVVVNAPGSLFYYDFETTVPTLISNQYTNAPTIVGGHLMAFRHTEGQSLELVAWRIGDWRQQKSVEVEMALVNSVVASHGRLVIRGRRFDQPMQLVEVDEHLQIAPFPNFAPGIDFALLADKIVYVKKSPPVRRESVWARDRPLPAPSPKIDRAFIDELFAAVYQSPPTSDRFLTLDVNHDNRIDQRDIDLVFDAKLDTHRADVSLDGTVDFTDFLLVSTNFGTANAKRSDGDVNGDGRIDIADFSLVANAFGSDSADGPMQSLTLNSEDVDELGQAETAADSLVLAQVQGQPQPQTQAESDSAHPIDAESDEGDTPSQPRDRNELASELVADELITGHLESWEDVEQFFFDAQPNEFFRFKLTALTLQHGPILQIHDAEGRQLTKFETSSSVSYSWQADKAGRYYVSVSKGRPVGTYELSMTRSFDDHPDHANESAPQVVLGTAEAPTEFSGRLDARFEADVIRFTARAGQVVYAEQLGDAAFSLPMKLLRTSRAPRGYYVQAWKIMEDGVYYLQLGGSDCPRTHCRSSAIGDYRIAIWAEDDDHGNYWPEATTVVPVERDTWDIQGRYEYRRDVDYFRLTVPAGTRYHLKGDAEAFTASGQPLSDVWQFSTEQVVYLKASGLSARDYHFRIEPMQQFVEDVPYMEVGSTISGTVALGEVLMRRWVATPGMAYEFRANSDVALSLRHIDGDILFQCDHCRPWLVRIPESANGDESIELLVQSSYRHSSFPYELTIEALPTLASDHPSTISDGVQVLELGQAVQGVLETYNDIDLFAFDALAGQTFKVDRDYAIWSTEGKIHRKPQFDDPPGWRAPADGRYYVAIGGNNWSGKYSFTLASPGLDVHPDTVGAGLTILDLQIPQHGRSEHQTDADVFAVPVIASQYYQFDVIMDWYSGKQVELQLLDDEGRVLAESVGGRLNWQASADGMAYVAVTVNVAEIRWRPIPYTVRFTQRQDDWPNQKVDGATPELQPGASVRGKIDFPLDRDAFLLQARPGQMTIDVQRFSQAANTTLSLHDSAGQLITRKLGSTLTWEVTTPQQYFVTLGGTVPVGYQLSFHAAEGNPPRD